MTTGFVARMKSQIKKTGKDSMEEKNGTRGGAQRKIEKNGVIEKEKWKREKNIMIKKKN